MSLRRFVQACGLLLAVIAFTSPFWLFSSSNTTAPSQIVATRAQEHKAADKPDTATSGTIDLEQLNSTPTPDKQAQSSPDTKSTSAPILSPDLFKDKNSGNTQNSNTTDTRSQHPNETTATADKAANDKAAADQKHGATQDNAADKDKNQNQDKAVTRDKSANKDNTASKNTASSKNQALSDNKDKSKSSDKTAVSDQKKSASKTTASEDNGKDDGNEQFKMGALASTMLSDTVLEDSPANSIGVNSNEEIDDATLSLQQKVNALTRNQTKAQKEAYQESIIQRQEQVDAAIASIEKSSRAYFPPFMSSRALVVYFSVTTKTQNKAPNSTAPVTKLWRSPETADAYTGATRIKVSHDDGVTIKTTQDPAVEAIARMLSDTSGAGIYQISTVKNYPDNLALLHKVAFTELNTHNLPELTDDVPLNLECYDTIYLCYPLWWSDMPGALYSFFDKYDLSGKVIIPVCLQAGDGFAQTIQAISTLEPNAMIYTPGLLLTPTDCKNTEALQNKLTTFLQTVSKIIN